MAYVAEGFVMKNIGAYRRGGSDTMMEGAHAIAPNLKTLRERVLSLFELGEMTDTELLLAYRQKYDWGEYRTISPRRYELVDAGLLVDTGRRRRNPHSGVNNIIWALTPRALEQLAAQRASLELDLEKLVQP